MNFSLTVQKNCTGQCYTSYRNQPIYLHDKSIDWFLYARNITLMWFYNVNPVLCLLKDKKRTRNPTVGKNKAELMESSRWFQYFFFTKAPYILLTLNYVKSVHIRSFFWPVFSRIQSEYEKIRNRKTPYLDTFHRVLTLLLLM